jgi:hypothetical protein
MFASPAAVALVGSAITGSILRCLVVDHDWYLLAAPSGLDHDNSWIPSFCIACIASLRRTNQDSYAVAVRASPVPDCSPFLP